MKRLLYAITAAMLFVISIVIMPTFILHTVAALVYLAAALWLFIRAVRS